MKIMLPILKLLLALGGVQAIIATAFAQLDHKRVKEASFRILQVLFMLTILIKLHVVDVLDKFY